MTESRTRQVNLRMTDAEYVMLTAVAEYEGLTLSDWIRQSFRKAYRRIFGKDSPET